MRYPEIILAAFGCLSGRTANDVANNLERANNTLVEPTKQRVGPKVIDVVLTIVENLLFHDTNSSEPGAILGPFVPVLMGHFCRRFSACFRGTTFRDTIRRELALLSRVCVYAFGRNAFSANQATCEKLCAYLLAALLAYLRDELRCRKLSSLFATSAANLSSHRNAALRHNILFTICFLIPLLPFQDEPFRGSTPKYVLRWRLPMTFFAKLLAPSSRQGRQTGIYRREPRAKVVLIYATLARRPELCFRAFAPVAHFLRALNAWSVGHVNEYDFDRRLAAYEALDTRGTYQAIVRSTVQRWQHACSPCKRGKASRLLECDPIAPLICQFLFDLHDSEFVLREAALHALIQVRGGFAAFLSPIMFYWLSNVVLYVFCF